MGVAQERMKTLFNEPMRSCMLDPHPTLCFAAGHPPRKGGGEIAPSPKLWLILSFVVFDRVIAHRIFVALGPWLRSREVPGVTR